MHNCSTQFRSPQIIIIHHHTNKYIHHTNKYINMWCFIICRDFRFSRHHWLWSLYIYTVCKWLSLRKFFFWWRLVINENLPLAQAKPSSCFGCQRNVDRRLATNRCWHIWCICRVKLCVDEVNCFGQQQPRCVLRGRW